MKLGIVAKGVAGAGFCNAWIKSWVAWIAASAEDMLLGMALRVGKIRWYLHTMWQRWR
jgi:hypothetical protein